VSSAEALLPVSSTSNAFLVHTRERPFRSALAWIRATLDEVRAFIVGLLWNPTDLHGCALWLRPTRGVVKTGSLVSKWADQAGGHLLEAPTVVEQPRFVPHAEAFDGRSAIRFDGIGELLEQRGDVRLPFGRAAFSAFVVLSQAAVGVANGAAVLWSGAKPHVAIWMSASNVFYAYLERSYASDVSLMAGKAYLLGVVYGDEKATLYVNGLPVKEFTGIAMTRASTPAARLCVGGEASASNSFCGDLGDIVVYDRALDSAELAKLSSELMDHYGIRSSFRRSWFHRLEDCIETLFARLGGVGARG
jgi:hypothetical protein